MGFLSRTKNESVIFSQGERIGGEFVEGRITQAKRWLRFAAQLLLA
jgi:hypothetical protein